MTQNGLTSSRARNSSLALIALISLGSLCIVGTIFGGFGCGGALGGECVLDSDCDEALICAYEFCHNPCTETRDCDVAGGEECMMSHETSKYPYNYCRIPIACTGNAECGDSLICAEDKICRHACFQGGDCLGDQRCYQGVCRNEKNPPPLGWDAPAGLGAPCKIPSDCVSKNCNGVCVGCSKDFDCGGIRTCDPTALEGGMCMGGSRRLNGEVTPVVVGNLKVISATPNADGSMIYFIAVEPSGASGLYKIPLSNGFANGQPMVICSDVSVTGEWLTEISISSDDSALFLGGNAGIFVTATTSTTCNNFQLVSWTQGVATHQLAIYEQNGIDTIYFSDYENVYAGSIDIGSLWIAGTMSLDIAVGETRKFLLNEGGQVREIREDMSMGLLVPDAGLRIHNMFMRMDLNLASDTVYVVNSTGTAERIIATHLSKPYEHQQYNLTTLFAQGGGPGDIARARKKDFFSWATGDGRLMLFEPK